MAVTRQLTDEHDYRRNVVSCSRDKACHAAFIGFGWNLCNGDQSGCCGSQTRVPFHLGNTPLGDGGSTLNKPSTNYCHFSRSSAHLKPPYQPGLMQRVKRFWRIFGPTKNMDAEFRNIQQIFAENNLRLPTLNLLVPDAHLYTTIAIQPGGNIVVRNDFLGHADRSTAKRQFSNFFRLAVERDCDLALSPEYSCPWAVLSDAITRRLLPQMGKIWMLGCEAIAPNDLQAVISAHTDVKWIYENIPNGVGFLDVLAYITKAETTAGDVRDVIVLQFKTQAMGGGAFERDHLILGHRIYIWRNPQENIRLISLICADALAFDDTAVNDCRFDLYPYIVFHPQLVQDPKHAAYRQYRSRLFTQNVSERFEVLTLNWARGFTLPDCQPNPYGGSAIYTKSARFETGDERLNTNHRRGLFYTHWYEQHTEMCLFSFDPHVFHYQIPKTLQNVPAPQGQRTGPEMISLLCWDPGSQSWRDSPDSNDGFAEFCTEFQQQACDFCLNTPHTTVDRERLLTLSAGMLRRMRSWHNVRNMDSFTAEADERSKRLTFTHEQAPASNDFRRSHMARYITLQMNILADPTNFPPTIQDLSGDWKLQPPQATDGFRFNLLSRSGQVQGATAIFIDLVPPAFAEQLKDDLVREWGQIETRRLVIWYRFQNAIRCIHPPLPSITDDSEPPASIASPTIL